MNKDIWICIEKGGSKYLRPCNHANCESVSHQFYEAEAERKMIAAPQQCEIGQLYDITKIKASRTEMKLKGYEFIMEFPNENGVWEKYLCSTDLHVGDTNVFPNMQTFDHKWREESHLFDITDPMTITSFDYDDTWKESRINTSHGYGRKSDYFKIIRKL